MYRQSEKNLLSSSISSTCPHNMVNFDPLAAEIVSGVWGNPATLSGFRVLQHYCTACTGSSGRQPNFAALNRGRHLCSAGRPSRWALAYIFSLLQIILPCLTTCHRPSDCPCLWFRRSCLTLCML